MKTAETVVTTKEKYIKKGARNVDLKGYDTKMIGRIRNKTVYIRPDKIKYKGKTRIIYRDFKGRFASIKPQKRR